MARSRWNGQPGGGERSRAGRPLIVTDIVKDDAELFSKFIDNEGFKRWMTDRAFELSCEQAAAPWRDRWQLS